MIKKALFCALMPVCLFAYQLQPWFPELLEFQFIPAYTFQRYPDLQGGFNPSKYASNDNIVTLDFQVSPYPSFDFQTEIDFSSSRAKDFGFRSGGVQLRYLFLNDVEGDPVSFSVGLNSHFVKFSRLQDVSAPFHYVSNFELGSALGKEVTREQYWVARFWGYAGGGIANRGEPWARAKVAIWGNIKNTHRIHLFSEGFFGFGNKERINIRRHDGYYNVRHRSVDVGATYQYHFEIWGDLSLEYFYRPYAHAFPKNLQSITLRYQLPFSVF